MEKYLYIKSFKAIKNNIKLKDLGLVNYMVGINGSGKSSILAALSTLNDERFGQIFMNNDSYVELELKNKKSFIKYNQTLKNGERKTNGDLKIKCYIRENSLFSGLNADVTQLRYDYTFEKWNDEEKSVQFTRLNKTLAKYGLDKIEIHNEGGEWNSRIVFKQSSNDIQPNQLAEGFKAMNEFLYMLDTIEKDLKNSWYLENYDSFLVLLDEPENNLHPTFQKLIPELIDSFLENIEYNLRENVYFFVSTHSPFIIGSSSNFKNQKVYLLDKGQLLEIKNNDSLVEAVSENSGYSSSQCAWIVGRMLGADVTDFGYPENYCIIEEYSMQIILEKAKAKGIIKNYQFISASGINNVSNMKESIENIKNISTIIKCNPYYSDKYYVVVDNFNSLKEKEKIKLEKIRSSIKNRLIELSKDSLEEYYFNVNKNIYQQYVEEVNIGKNEIGKIKANYANTVSELITSKEKFSELFNNELDFLIK